MIYHIKPNFSDSVKKFETKLFFFPFCVAIAISPQQKAAQVESTEIIPPIYQLLLLRFHKFHLKQIKTLHNANTIERK